MRGIDADILFLLGALLPLKASPQRKGCDQANARRYEPREQIGFLPQKCCFGWHILVAEIYAATIQEVFQWLFSTGERALWLWAGASIHERALAFSWDTISSARAS